MKVKAKLDSEAIKKFFAKHGEKLTFGVLALVCVLLLRSALKVPMFPTDAPATLQGEVTRVRTDVEGRKFQADKYNVPTRIEPGKNDYPALVTDALKRLNPEQYVFSSPMNPPLYENKARRDKPVLLAALKPQASYAYGALLRQQESGLEGRRWTMVTLLVPVRAQTEEFDKVLKRSRYPIKDKDTPAYIDMKIERAVAAPGTSVDKLVWAEFNWQSEFVEARKALAASNLEVVDRALREASVCMPLFPVAGMTYHTYREPLANLYEGGAHPPELAYALQQEEAKDGARTTTSRPAEAATTASGGNPLAEQANERQAVLPAAASTQPGTTAAAVKEVPEYHLCRFYDYGVQPHKAYRYRVKLVLKNPNFGVVDRQLKDATLASGETLTTEWSEVSPEVSFPRQCDFDLLAGDVKAGVGIVSVGTESSATLVLVKWAPAYGVMAACEFPVPSGPKVNRGTLLNFVGTSTKVAVPGKPGELTDATVDFITNSVLLDMVGGDSMSQPSGARVRAPSEQVFLRDDGEVVLRDTIDDSKWVDLLKPATAAPAAAASTTETPVVQ